HRLRQELLARLAQRGLDAIDARELEGVVRGEAPLDLGARGPRVAVGFLHALAAVAPLPLDFRTVELLDVVTALELGGKEDVRGREREARRGAQLHPGALAAPFLRVLVLVVVSPRGAGSAGAEGGAGQSGNGLVRHETPLFG